MATSDGIQIPFTVTTERERTLDALIVLSATIRASAEPLHDDNPYKKWLYSLVDKIEPEADRLEQCEGD
jgi:hypothetical protein